MSVVVQFVCDCCGKRVDAGSNDEFYFPTPEGWSSRYQEEEDKEDQRLDVCSRQCGNAVDAVYHQANKVN